VEPEVFDLGGEVLAPPPLDSGIIDMPYAPVEAVRAKGVA
jgi:hypothetical protein